jgi:2-dehydropantoate 2-reductase
MKKVLIFGGGAIGLNYGLRLLETEKTFLAYNATPPFQVFFYVRRDYESIKAYGITFICEDSTMVFPAEDFEKRIFRSAEDLLREHGTMDVVIIGLKGYSFTPQILQILSSLGNPTITDYLIIVNGLGIEEKLATVIPIEHIFGAVSFIACNRIYNNDHNSASSSETTAISSSFPPHLTVRNVKDHRLEIGHYLDNLDILNNFLTLWESTTIKSFIIAVPSLLATRWSKLCWNITFSGIAIAMGGITIDVIDHDPSLHFLADTVMEECIAVAQKNLRYHYEQQMQQQLQDQLIDAAMIPIYIEQIDEKILKEKLWLGTKNIGAYKTSTVVDLINNEDMEIETIFSVPLDRARFLAEKYSDLTFAHMESVIDMVKAQYRIQRRKREEHQSWNPVWIQSDPNIQYAKKN